MNTDFAFLVSLNVTGTFLLCVIVLAKRYLNRLPNNASLENLDGSKEKLMLEISEFEANEKEAIRVYKRFQIAIVALAVICISILIAWVITFIR